MRKAKWTITLMLALIFAMSGGALAQVRLATAPLPANQIPMYAQPLDLLSLTGIGIPVTVPAINPVPGTQEISLCEFQANILPPGTPIIGAVAGVAPSTNVWGYQTAATCTPGLATHSYLGPVVIPQRGTPTTMNFHNFLPDANLSMVRAFATSTDQTLVWGDPLSFDPVAQLARVTIPYPVYPPAIPQPAEFNDCYEAAHLFHLGQLLALPAGCLDNYGFTLGVPWANPPGIAPTPAAVHLHGGEVPAVLDGGPDAWFTGNGIYGHGFYSKGGVADAALNTMTYVYPNTQEAAPVWFHDHILGATRLNVYAGIAGGYYITTSVGVNGIPGVVGTPAANLPPGMLELGLDRNGNGLLDLCTPNLAVVPPVCPTGITDEVLIPLIIQDRQFDRSGQLFFPAAGINPEHPYWVPEFMGDTIAVNGKVWPFLSVDAKRYRFLVLNGSNARAYELGFADVTPKPVGKPAPARVMPTIWVIGNDQGYLKTPAAILPGALPANKLVIMPGERYEIIVDFGTVPGATLNMTNTAGFPYPLGVPPTKWTAQVMQFRVNPAVAGFVDSSYNPASGASVRTDTVVRLADSPVIHKRRRLTLNEVLAKGGPLEILVNNTLYEGGEPGLGNATINTRPTNDFKPVTTMGYNTTYYSELPNEGETELWEIVNLTVDAHPMHPHLVAFQILNRQAFDALAYPAAYALAFPGGGLDPATGLPYPAGVYIPGFGPPLDYNCNLGLAAQNRGFVDPAQCVFGGNPDPALSGIMGPVIPPAPQETGWKDTVMAPPGMVTRVLVRFAPTHFPANALADQIGYEFDPGEMHGYVWHCHIIDHEDNEMMRPYMVQTNPGAAALHTFIGGGVNY